MSSNFEVWQPKDGRGKKTLYPFKHMEVGEVAKIEVANKSAMLFRRRATAAAREYGKKYGKKFKVRTTVIIEIERSQ